MKMESKNFLIKKFLLTNSNCPFDLWFEKLDFKTKVIIDARLARVRVGNFGNCRSVEKGVFELKIDHGPGYRIYYGIEGKYIVILLCAGNKSSQAKDIIKAQKLWEIYKR